MQRSIRWVMGLVVCVTKPVTTALFLAQASLLRFYPPDPDRYKPGKQRPF